ncbi:MAG: hypothetical protein ABI649_04440 [Gaiellaceae bacterium]
MPHLRPPAFSPGFTALVWAIGLGAYIFLGLLAIGTSSGSALLFAIVAGALIFFYVRLHGADQLRR